MGEKWIYRLKTEDFANVAQRLNVVLDGRLEDMRKALSEYSRTYEVTVPSEYQVLSWPRIPRARPSGEPAASVCRVCRLKTSSISQSRKGLPFRSCGNVRGSSASMCR